MVLNNQYTNLNCLWLLYYNTSYHNSNELYIILLHCKIQTKNKKLLMLWSTKNGHKENSGGSMDL